MTRFLIACIRLYQVALSPFFGQQCRFHPTCSHYAIACIQKHGALSGVVLTIKRLARCHPWHAGGSDPVP
ncbi:MAG: membrane protein insertion efficiency factor YidD [Pseudomonadota bacterium]